MQILAFSDRLTPQEEQQLPRFSLFFSINTYAFTMRHTHHDYWDFTILLDGLINHYIDSKCETISKNTLFFARKENVHHFENVSDDKIRYINLMVREDFLTSFFQLFPMAFKEFFYRDVYSIPMPEDLVYKIDNMLHKIKNLSVKKDVNNEMLYPVFLMIMQHLFSESLSLRFDEFESSSTPFFNALENIMQNPVSPTYTVKDLCAQLNYSRMQLNRLFKKYLNTTPHGYLLSYKLHYAKELLHSTNMKILDIAMEAGYSNISQFNRNFKKAFGLTPGEYRKKRKLNDFTLAPSSFLK